MTLRVRRLSSLLLPARVVVVAISAAFAFGLLSSCQTDEGNTRDDEVKSEPVPLKRMFLGPIFVTNDPERPEAAAIVVGENGKIERVLGELPRKLQGYEFVRLTGALAVPGLHDAHAHTEGVGRAKEDIDLRGVASPAELRTRIQMFAEGHPEIRVITGRGWDQSLFPDKTFPTSKDIEGATDRPVLVRRVDGHAALANQAMLNLAHITAATTAPDGGRIIRGDDGRPTGIFVDNAMELLFAVLPPPTLEDRKRWLTEGMNAFADAGLVAVHDMGMSVETYTALSALDAEGALPVRVFVYLDATDNAALETLRTATVGNRVSLMGVKHLVDGAMGSRGAALLADYSDEAGTRGLVLTPPETLAASIKSVDALGKQVAVHAIGDRGIRLTLDAVASAQATSKDRRHRVEHSQLVNASDIPRYAAEKVVASMQPTHATSDMRWVEARVGKDRAAGAYAWQTFLNAGVPLAFGSDAPVESERVVLGLYAAVTRQDAEGNPPDGFMPEQRVSIADAIAAFSSGAAFAVKRESDLGVLREGAQFDVTLFDIDPRADARKWLVTKPVATFVDGTERGGAN